MKKLAGLFVLVLLGLSGAASARVRPPDVILDVVVVSSPTLTPAFVRGTVSSQGRVSNAQGTVNPLNQISLPFYISISSPVAPATYRVNGSAVGFGGVMLSGTTQGNFTLISSSPTQRIPVTLFLQ